MASNWLERTSPLCAAAMVFGVCTFASMASAFYVPNPALSASSLASASSCRAPPGVIRLRHQAAVSSALVCLYKICRRQCESKHAIDMTYEYVRGASVCAHARTRKTCMRELTPLRDNHFLLSKSSVHAWCRCACRA